ncbi:unnamed protein product [Closterium sp. Yama58-4]|nr:unnamed protein product [Closterium sp. Yama58-4]
MTSSKASDTSSGGVVSYHGDPWAAATMYDTSAVPIFTGQNYSAWKFKFQVLMMERGLWGLFDGSEKRPTDNESAIAAWKKKDQKAFATLISRIGINLVSSVRMCIKLEASAHEAWKRLETMHVNKTLHGKILARNAFYTVKLRAGESMHEYATRVEEFGETFMDLGGTVTEEDWILTLLCGLPEEWSTVITTLDNGEGNVHTASGEADESKESLVLVAGNGNETPSDTWFLDTGATQHMTHSASLLNNIGAPGDVTSIVFGNNESLPVVGVGSTRLIVDRGPVDITNVLHVPGVKVNLLSVPKLAKKGVIATIDGAKMNLFWKGEQFAQGVLNGDIYQLKTYPRVASSNVASSNVAQGSKATLKAWHNRIAHANYDSVKELANKGLAKGVDVIAGDDEKGVCVACVEGKMARKPFGSRTAMGHVTRSQHGLSQENDVVEAGDVAEAGGQGPSEYVQGAAGKGKAVKGTGERGKGGNGSGGKKAEWGPETITERGKGKGVEAHTCVLPPPLQSKGHSQPWVPIMRCRADVDFVLAFLTDMFKVPKCSQCLKCLRIFINHVPCCALIANFAYRPVDALVTRFLAAFPARSPESHRLLKALLLRSPLTTAEHTTLINESSPAREKRAMTALHQWHEQVTELPRDARMRESVMRLKARQMPLLLVLAVALYHAQPIMGVSHTGETGSHNGNVEMIARQMERVLGSGGSVGGVDDGQVWVEVESWCFAMMYAWHATTKVMGPGLLVSCGKDSSHVPPSKAGAPMLHEWGVELWAQAATPRFRDDMCASHGGCGDACADSSSGASGGGGGERESEDGKGEVPGYLKPWPGGINLLACLREMLLGEVCYRPACPAASSTHGAAASVCVSTRPVPSSAAAAPSTAPEVKVDSPNGEHTYEKQG